MNEEHVDNRLRREVGWMETRCHLSDKLYNSVLHLINISIVIVGAFPSIFTRHSDPHTDTIARNVDCFASLFFALSDEITENMSWMALWNRVSQFHNDTKAVHRRYDAVETRRRRWSWRPLVHWHIFLENLSWHTLLIHYQDHSLENYKKLYLLLGFFFFDSFSYFRQ